jgi:NTE family protein
VATDVESLKPIYFTEGKIRDVIYYSLSMPGIIPPDKYNGKMMTDGDISDRLPINKLFESGMKKVVAVDL